MRASPESGILLVGLADAGKTNFLVGLDVILDNQVDPSGLMHSDYAADRAYLEPLRWKWLRAEHFDHTNRQVPPPPHQLLVHHRASGTHVTFHIPDLAGETFNSHFVTRSLPRDFGLRLQLATGLILFLHCDHEADHDLLEHPRFVDAVPATEAQIIPLGQVTEWSIDLASKQVKLVDLLQFVAELREVPLRIAIAISAWDLVEKAPTGLSPKEPWPFLLKQWPLLAQYLESNRNTFSFRTFGVSARGGGTSTEEIERLTKFTHPRDRVILVDGDHRSNDLTRPVRWLLGLLDTPDSSNA